MSTEIQGVFIAILIKSYSTLFKLAEIYNNQYFYKKSNKMDIHNEKLGLIEWILKINDLSIIKELKNIQKSHSNSDDWWNQLKQEELESIKRGLKDIEEGRIHTHETVKKMYEKYL